MYKTFLSICFLQLFVYVQMQHIVNETQLSVKRDNPNFIRDRKKDLIYKPQMPSMWANKDRKPFDKAWMDYCDPYHCNDYHRIACGLNRASMKFKWFQSICHVILHNQCANYRGSIRYDLIDSKFCRAYVMFLRAGCPDECSDEIEPVCGMSSIDGHVVIFKNQCSLESLNCRNSTLQEYDAVYMGVCEYTMLSRSERYGVLKNLINN